MSAKIIFARMYVILPECKLSFFLEIFVVSSLIVFPDVADGPVLQNTLLIFYICKRLVIFGEVLGFFWVWLGQ